MKGIFSLFILACVIFSTNPLYSQCDVEVSGVLAYCNAIRGSNNTFSGYFIGFRIKSENGDTLDVVDLTGNVPMNLGKRIDDINTQEEPSDTSRAKVKIAGGIDSLEFWYFGPFANGDSFNIALVDPQGICDTVFVASGTFTCTGQDPNACDADVPLYFLDFSLSEWNIGGGGSSNEDFDAIFLIMQRSRVSTCCQTNNQRCFEFIITLAEDDIGLLIDDVGSGSTAGYIYADSLNGFACGTNQNDTWPYYQDGGQSADDPLCIEGSVKEWIVLSCKQGNNVTGVSFGTVGTINILPEYVYEDCTVQLEVQNVISVVWSSPDDPNLDNLINFNLDSTLSTFSYDENIFGPITSCDGDTFTYYVGGFPDNTCLPSDSLLYDTTFVVVYPGFSVIIDSTCLNPDSILLEAVYSSSAGNCGYQFNWSTGDTTTTIIVPSNTGDYSISVTRDDIDSLVNDCSPATDIIHVEPFTIACQPDMFFECITNPPEPDNGIVDVTGCGVNHLIFSMDINNGGSGCGIDSLIISRHYIVDFDGDTINTIDDRDTCIQRFAYVDNQAPVINCPQNVTLSCLDSTLPSATGFATASDNCDESPDIIYTDVINEGSCPQEYVINRIWSATDQCGHSSTCNQTIAIEDNLGPAITCPSNVTIQCGESTLPPGTGFATAADICDPAHEITYTNGLTAGPCPIYLRTWTATDDCGNFSTCIQSIYVQDTVSPVITCPSNITITYLESTLPSNTGQAGASDNCDTILAVTYNDLMPVNCFAENKIVRTWMATDDCGNPSSCQQNITIEDLGLI